MAINEKPDGTLPADPSAQETQIPDDQKLDRRRAIAQARAIRREAAAMEQEAKAQAAETANIILEQAAPPPPKKKRHKHTRPQPISNTTGKFGWLDEVKPAPNVDTEAIVDELIAESAERASQSDDTDEETPEKEAIVEQIVAEHASENSDPEAAIAQVLAATAPSAQPDPAKEARRFVTEQPAQSREAAAEAFRQETNDAADEVRRMGKAADRAWKKEAASVRAARTVKKTVKRTAGCNVIVCLLLLFGIAAGMLIFERPTVSMEENRTLAKMPEFSVETYLDGEFTNGVSEYYNDTVPFRSVFKGLTQSIRKYMGMQGGPVIHGGVPVLENAPEQDTPAETATTPAVTAVPQTDPNLKAETTAETVTETTPAPPPEEAPAPDKEGEISNNILIVDNRGIMLFGGWETMGETYAENVNRYKQDLPDVNVYSMVVPTPCSFYTPEEFQYLISSEKKNIDYISTVLKDVKPVNVYDTLERHKDEPIFMRTDHHWSALGAFYAAEQFSAVARVPFARIEEYEKHEKEGYVGTLYGYSGDITLKENPETFFWYTPKASFRTTFMTSDLGSPHEGNFFADVDKMATASWYLVYMCGDDHVVHINTDMKNGRKLCVIKDSYGNALIPWLTSSFEDIYVIDMRYFKANAVKYMKDEGVTDLLFAMNTYSASGGNGKKIEQIRRW